MAFESSASPLCFSNIFDGIFWMLAILNSLKIKAKVLAAVPLDDYLVREVLYKNWP